MADSVFDALQEFRGLDQTQKEERLFLDMQSVIIGVKGIEARLDILNGSTAITRTAIEAHLGTHRNSDAQTMGRQAVGISAQKAVVVAAGLSAAILAAVEIIQHFMGGS